MKNLSQDEYDKCIMNKIMKNYNSYCLSNVLGFDLVCVNPYQFKSFGNLIKLERIYRKRWRNELNMINKEKIEPRMMCMISMSEWVTFIKIEHAYTQFQEMNEDSGKNGNPTVDVAMEHIILNGYSDKYEEFQFYKKLQDRAFGGKEILPSEARQADVDDLREESCNDDFKHDPDTTLMKGLTISEEEFGKKIDAATKRRNEKIALQNSERSSSASPVESESPNSRGSQKTRTSLKTRTSPIARPTSIPASLTHKSHTQGIREKLAEISSTINTNKTAVEAFKKKAIEDRLADKLETIRSKFEHLDTGDDEYGDNDEKRYTVTSSVVRMSKGKSEYISEFESSDESRVSWNQRVKEVTDKIEDLDSTGKSATQEQMQAKIKEFVNELNKNNSDPDSTIQDDGKCEHNKSFDAMVNELNISVGKFVKSGNYLQKDAKKLIKDAHVENSECGQEHFRGGVISFPFTPEAFEILKNNMFPVEKIMFYDEISTSEMSNSEMSTSEIPTSEMSTSEISTSEKSPSEISTSDSTLVSDISTLDPTCSHHRVSVDVEFGDDEQNSLKKFIKNGFPGGNNFTGSSKTEMTTSAMIVKTENGIRHEVHEIFSEANEALKNIKIENENSNLKPPRYVEELTSRCRNNFMKIATLCNKSQKFEKVYQQSTSLLSSLQLAEEQRLILWWLCHLSGLRSFSEITEQDSRCLAKISLGDYSGIVKLGHHKKSLKAPVVAEFENLDLDKVQKYPPLHLMFMLSSAEAVAAQLLDQMSEDDGSDSESEFSTVRSELILPMERQIHVLICALNIELETIEKRSDDDKPRLKFPLTEIGIDYSRMSYIRTQVGQLMQDICIATKLTNLKVS